MNVEKNNVIFCYYKLYENDIDGVLLEETLPTAPIGFIYGIGMMIPGFEKNIVGLSEGDAFEFPLAPSDAYGDINFNALKEIPIQNFMNEEGKLDTASTREGATVRMKNSKGFSFQGTVVSSDLTSVKVDFNHPMAGKALYFQGTILSIRKANNQELETKRVTMPII